MRRLTCGFGTLSLATEPPCPAVLATSGSATATIDTTTVRYGGGSAKFVSASDGTASIYTKTEAVGVSVLSTYARAYMYFTAFPSADCKILSLFNGSTLTDLAWISVTSGGALKLIGPSGQIGSSSSALSLNTWYGIELKVGRLDTPRVEARVWTDSGTPAAFASGDNGVNANPHRVYFGAMTATSGMTVYITDIAVNDTAGSAQTSYPGSGRVKYLRPNAAGDNNAWQKADGSTGDSSNYNLCDETTPDGDTTYVKRLASAQPIDDYNVETASDVGIDTGASISVVSVNGRAMASGAAGDSRAIYYRLKGTSGGTVVESYKVDISVTDYITGSDEASISYTSDPITATVNPATGVAWTVSDLDTIQIGFRTASVSTTLSKVSAVWAIVEYTLSTVQHGTITEAGTASITGAAQLARKTAPTIASTAAATPAGLLTRKAAPAVAGTGQQSGASRYETHTPASAVGAGQIAGAPRQEMSANATPSGLAALDVEGQVIPEFSRFTTLAAQGALEVDGRWGVDSHPQGAGDVLVASRIGTGAAPHGTATLAADPRVGAGATQAAAGGLQVDARSAPPIPPAVEYEGLFTLDVDARLTQAVRVLLSGVGQAAGVGSQAKGASVTLGATQGVYQVNVLTATTSLGSSAGLILDARSIDDGEPASVDGVAGLTIGASRSTQHAEVAISGWLGVATRTDTASFPKVPIPVRCEILFDDWVDVTPYTHAPQDAAPACLTRAMWRQGDSATTDPGKCTLRLLSPAGVFNFRNVAGPFWRPEGWRGLPVRVWVDEVEFFTGIIDTYPTEYDMDGDEYCNLTIVGPLARPYSAAGMADPIGDTILNSSPAPRLFWKLDESSGASRFASGLSDGSPFGISGVVRGLAPGSGFTAIGAIDGPPGTAGRFTNLSLDLNAATAGNDQAGPPKAVFPNFADPYSGPVARWSSQGKQQYGFERGLCIDYCLRVDSGHSVRYGAYSHRVDPDLYPEGDEWTGAPIFSTVDNSNYGRISSLVYVQLANGLTIASGPAEVAGGYANGPQRVCTWGNYLNWGIAVQVGTTVGAGVLGKVPGGNAVKYLESQQVQDVLFDGGWHHVRIGVSPGSEVSVWLDGVQLLTGPPWYTVDDPYFQVTPAQPIAINLMQYDATIYKLKAASVGYLSLYSGTTWPTQPTLSVTGNAGETATERCKRVLTGQGIPWVDSEPSTVPLARQDSQAVADTVAACEYADAGRILELPTGEVTYEPPMARYLTTRPTFDLTQNQLGAPPELSGPAPELYGTLTAKRTGALEGDLDSITIHAPWGVTAATLDVGVATLARLFSWAGAKANWNQAGEDSSVALRLNLAATPELIRTWLTAVRQPPIRITVTGIPGVHEPLELFVNGFTESIAQFDWIVDLYCAPATPYRAGWLENGPRVLRAGMDSIVAAPAEPEAGTIVVFNPEMPQLDTSPATYPVDAEILGERLTINSVTTAAVEMMGSGTATAAPGVIVTFGDPVGRTITPPGLPLWAAPGDTLIMLVATLRGTALAAPPGWATLAIGDPQGAVSLAMFGRRFTGVPAKSPVIYGPAPVVAQILAIRGASNACLTSESTANGAQKNVSVPSGYWAQTIGQHVTIHAAGRRGTWASVALPPQLTTAGGASVGGLSVAWGWGAPRTGLLAGQREFVPSSGGGPGSGLAMAVSTGAQSLSVTRSVNGIGRFLAGGESVSLWRPATLGI